MFYLAKTPKWVKKLFPASIWQLPANRKTLYLTFDDGPHPGVGRRGARTHEVVRQRGGMNGGKNRTWHGGSDKKRQAKRVS